MSYGLTLDQVRQINHPAPLFAAWGSVTACTQLPQFGLYRIDLSAGAAQPLHFHPSGPYQLFVETGDILVRILDKDGNVPQGIVNAGALLSPPLYSVDGLASREDAVVYFFGPHSDEGLQSH